MFFELIRKKISFLNSQKPDSIRKEGDLDQFKSRKNKAEYLALDQASCLVKNKEFEKALKVINQTLNNGIKTNKLLFQKAWILSQVNHFDEAHEIWSKLSKLERKPKLAFLAKRELEISKKSMLDTTKKMKSLLDNLHVTAEYYEKELKRLPQSQDWTLGVDLILSIEQEAKLARTAKLPMLALELIDQASQAGLESPLLIKEKAASLSMMGRKKKAVALLKELSQKANNRNLQASIKKDIQEAKNAKTNQLDVITYLCLQAVAVSRANKVTPQFIPDTKQSQKDTDIKLLVFREARKVLPENPNASLGFMNAILNYFPKDLAALQLKGESLAALGKDEEAIATWGPLIDSKNTTIANEASRLIVENLSQRVLEISSRDSPKVALSFFIENHIKYDLTPVLNENINTILRQIEHANTDLSDSVLQQHRLHLTFNTHLIECLEARFREENRLGWTSPAQKPGAIRKTALKPG